MFLIKFIKLYLGGKGMKKKKRLTAFIMSLFLFATLVMPVNITKVYAEDNDKINNNQAVVGDESNVEEQSLEITNLSKGNKIVDILSFNDFHGNVLESGKNIGAAKLAGVVNEYKAKANTEYGVIPVSAGDLYQGTAISNLTTGKPVTAMVKDMGLEASAIGNHEFDWGVDNINTWVNGGGFQFLAANIVKKGTEEKVSYAQPYKVVERNGVKIGLIGISTPETATSTLAENVKDVDFLDPVKTVAKWNKVLRETEKVDAVVVIAHAGAYQDSNTKEITGEAANIAKVEGVDAVIAGHNHAVVSGEVNGVPVVEGGYNGRALAKLTFTFDDSNKLLDVKPSVDVFLGKESTLPVDENVLKEVKNIKEGLNEILGKKVTSLEERLSHDDKNTAVTPLGATVAETMRKIVGTEIAVTNGGGIRRSLEQGDVTVGDMYEILPFDNTLVTLDVKGSDLYSIIEHGINTEGFAWGQFAGIKVWYNPKDGKVSSIRLNDGTKIDMDKYYSVAINDFMLTGGDKYDFSNAINAVNTNVVMRDAMAEEWNKNGAPELDFNVLVAGEDTTVDKPTEEEKPTEPNVPKEENKPSIPNANKSSNPSKLSKPSKLPQTGAPITPDVFGTMGIMAIALGGYIVKKKKSA